MKKTYMTRLERAARWRLPPKEAEDVIADYREMVGDPLRPEEELRRELGRPRDAIRPLTRKRPYYTWLAVFAFLSLCILSFGISVYNWRLFLIYFGDHIYGTRDLLSRVVSALSAVTALVWFRWQGRKEARLPRAIPILLAALMALCGGIILYCWAFSRDFDGFLDAWGTMPALIGPNPGEPISVSFYLVQDIMIYGSLVLSLAAVFWLVKARTGDRRWAAVYIMAFTVILAALNVVALIQSMDTTFEEIFRQLLIESTGITAAGIIGAGVALC